MRVAAGLISALAFLTLTSVASAADDAELRTQSQEQNYLRQLLENPSDRSLNLNYAAQAMQLHDYEAAISPLERILMHEPDNAKIHLQIGILYHLLGSDLIARQYFEDTLATPGVSPAITEEAQGYLRGI